MSKEEIEKAVKEAEAMAAEDKRRREEAEVRNNADSAVYNAEKMLKESEGKGVDPSLLDAVKNAIEPVKDALKGSDTAAIKQATEKLTEAVYKLSSAIYEKAGAGAGTGAGAGAGPQPGQEAGGGDHMDADFKVKDEDR